MANSLGYSGQSSPRWHGRGTSAALAAIDRAGGVTADVGGEEDVEVCAGGFGEAWWKYTCGLDCIPLVDSGGGGGTGRRVETSGIPVAAPADAGAGNCAPGTGIPEPVPELPRVSVTNPSVAGVRPLCAMVGHRTRRPNCMARTYLFGCRVPMQRFLRRT